jgi:hypothetical protein
MFLNVNKLITQSTYKQLRHIEWTQILSLWTIFSIRYTFKLLKTFLNFHIYIYIYIYMNISRVGQKLNLVFRLQNVGNVSINVTQLHKLFHKPLRYVNITCQQSFSSHQYTIKQWFQTNHFTEHNTVLDTSYVATLHIRNMEAQCTVYNFWFCNAQNHSTTVSREMGNMQ